MSTHCIWSETLVTLIIYWNLTGGLVSETQHCVATARRDWPWESKMTNIELDVSLIVISLIVIDVVDIPSEVK